MASDSSPRFIHANVMYVMATALAKTICQVFTLPIHRPDFDWMRYGGMMSVICSSKPEIYDV